MYILIKILLGPALTQISQQDWRYIPEKGVRRKKRTTLDLQALRTQCQWDWHNSWKRGLRSPDLYSWKRGKKRTNTTRRISTGFYTISALTHKSVGLANSWNRGILAVTYKSVRLTYIPEKGGKKKEEDILDIISTLRIRTLIYKPAKMTDC